VPKPQVAVSVQTVIAGSRLHCAGGGSGCGDVMGPLLTVRPAIFGLLAGTDLGGSVR